MKEVIVSADPRIAQLIARQAKQSPDDDGLGLERIAALLETVGRPQDRLPPVIHVAGTNGKGSTCAFLRAALEAAGHRVHVFTSPHLVRYNERIRLAGTLIDDDTLGALMGRVLDANEAIGASLFEVNVAVAMIAFADVAADACILEVGLGGRLDATNVVERPLVTAIAGLGLDHQAFLGKRLVDIAAEKAGIAKAGVPLVTQAYPAPIAARIGAIASQVGAKWMPCGTAWQAGIRAGDLHYRDDAGALTLPLPRLPGRHQAMNAALATAILRHQTKLAVSPQALADGITHAEWPGRLQHLAHGPLADMLPPGSELWIDGGHNPSAARLVAGHARKQWRDGLPLVILFASLTSKDARGTLAPFAPLAPRVLTLPILGHDCRDPGELAAMASAMGLEAHGVPDLAAALAAVERPSRVLVFGSLYLAGEALSANGSVPD